MMYTNIHWYIAHAHTYTDKQICIAPMSITPWCGPLFPFSPALFRPLPFFWSLAVTHANRALGLPDEIFAMGDDLVLTVLGQIGFMPVLVLAGPVRECLHVYVCACLRVSLSLCLSVSVIASTSVSASASMSVSVSVSRCVCGCGVCV